MRKYSTRNKKSKKNNDWNFLPWCLIILFSILFYIKQSSDIYQQGYELVKVKKMYREVKEIENYLNFQTIKLKSPNQIEENAQKNGLIRSNEEEIFLLTVKNIFDQ